MRHLMLFIIFLLPFLAVNGQSRATAKKAVKLMGCGFEIAAYAETDTIAWNAVEAGIKEIVRIEKLISEWDSFSQTSEIIRMAGIRPVKVDKELYDLIYRSGKISQLTDGAFDISFASMNKIYQFDKTERQMPDDVVIAAARMKIDYRKIILNPLDTSIYLEKGMRIGFGAIGKGYAANKAKEIMSKMDGVKGGVVNASGDLVAWGESESPEGWRVNIANPKNKNQAIAWFRIHDLAVVTSGDYEKYFISEGKRYSHIIDPKTGYPTSGVSSVTIFCPDAELADALATSVFVLGTTKGLDLINKLNNIECIIINDDGIIHQSKNLQINYY